MRRDETFITTSEISKQLIKCNEDFKVGKFKNHKQYQAKFNRIKNLNSLSNQIKRFGAKVTKEFKGYYIYNGVNFTAKFNEESCESTWWEVNTWEESTDDRVMKKYEDWNQYTTKNEILGDLLSFDKSLSL